MDIKAGDKVEFKCDVEGHGVVLEITAYDEYMVGEVGGENSTYPWHRMARFDHTHNRMVVYVDAYHIWKNDKED